MRNYPKVETIIKRDSFIEEMICYWRNCINIYELKRKLDHVIRDVIIPMSMSLKEVRIIKTKAKANVS